MSKPRTSANTLRELAQIRVEARVLLLAKRWAKHARTSEVLSSPSHHLLRAIDKLEELES